MLLTAFCGATIIMTDKLPNHIIGRYERGKIYVTKELSRNDKGYTIAHECGHHVTRYTELPEYFGRPPYISDYSMTNQREDFAEMYMYLKEEPNTVWRLARENRRMRKKILFVLPFLKNGA